MPRWLHLGMSIKRWLVLLLVGISLLAARIILRAWARQDHSARRTQPKVQEQARMA